MVDLVVVVWVMDLAFWVMVWCASTMCSSDFVGLRS